MLSSQDRQDDCVISSSKTRCSPSSVFVAMDRFVHSANNLESTVLIPSRLKDMTMPQPAKSAQMTPISSSPLPSIMSRNRGVRFRASRYQLSSRSSPPSSHAPSPAFSSSVSSDTSSSLLSPAASSSSFAQPSLASSTTSSSSASSQTTTCPHELYNMLKEVKKELLWGPTILNASLGLDLALAASYQQKPSHHFHNPHALHHQHNHLHHHHHHNAHSVLMLRDSSSDDGGSTSASTSSSVSATDDEPASSMLLSMFRYHLHSLHNILHQLADSADQLSHKYSDEVENYRSSR